MKFERGKNPKEAMGIGIEAQMMKFIKDEYPNLSSPESNHLLRICADHGKLDFCKYFN